jgi:hypothetical protein
VSRGATLVIMAEHPQADLESLHREFVEASREQAEAAEEWDRVFLPIEPLSPNGSGPGFTAEKLDAQRRLIAADERLYKVTRVYLPLLRPGG